MKNKISLLIAALLLSMGLSSCYMGYYSQGPHRPYYRARYNNGHHHGRYHSRGDIYRVRHAHHHYRGRR